jgi:hypothetical protein
MENYDYSILHIYNTSRKQAIKVWVIERKGIDSVYFRLLSAQLLYLVAGFFYPWLVGSG